MPREKNLGVKFEIYCQSDALLTTEPTKACESVILFINSL